MAIFDFVYAFSILLFLDHYQNDDDIKNAFLHYLFNNKNLGPRADFLWSFWHSDWLFFITLYTLFHIVGVEICNLQHGHLFGSSYGFKPYTHFPSKTLNVKGKVVTQRMEKWILCFIHEQHCFFSHQIRGFIQYFTCFALTYFQILTYLIKGKFMFTRHYVITLTYVTYRSCTKSRYRLNETSYIFSNHYLWLRAHIKLHEGSCTRVCHSYFCRFSKLVNRNNNIITVVLSAYINIFPSLM